MDFTLDKLNANETKEKKPKPAEMSQNLHKRLTCAVHYFGKEHARASKCCHRLL